MKRYIAITGASSGIGAAVTKAFARRGENLILIARRGELLENLKSEIAKFSGVDVVIEICDLSKQENAISLWRNLEKYELKALINNAGFGDYNKVGEQNLEKITQMINLNIISLVTLSTLFTKKYKDKDTQLINISSIGGYKIVPNAVTYCASKFFVSAFSEGLYHELAQDKQAKMQAKVLALAATKTEFGMVATSQESYDYDKAFKKYHTSEQMAEFLLRLYDSHCCVGSVDRDSFEFSLSKPKFDYAIKYEPKDN
ncbi:SDR family NAD(P)-dependent oxidoreductase [Campylobacter concisus]|uniref:SDR family NAD(P)-dependent oxidoreductase n=1 Tax=Campylobacter concisus TaxID=199 RepID=UPI000A017A9D|nr:SDR family NAD(P)-dependent oxidoreductase [Campylobacter concisus]ORI11843.1 oxidoreductase [Campylobacter concisus]